MSYIETNHNKVLELHATISLTFIYFTGYMMLQPILPLYIIDIGASKFELGILMSMMPLLTILTRIPFGYISDKFGKWFTLLMSLLMQLIAFLLYSIATSPIHLYPITSLYALSFASFGPVSIAMALGSASMNKRGREMGKYYTSIGLSMILGPLLAGFIALQFNYNEMLFLASFLPLFCIILFFIIYFKWGTMPSLEKSMQVIKENYFPFKSIFRILRSRNIFAICYAQIAFFIATGAFGTLYPIYAKETLWLTASTISILFAIRGFPNALIRIPIGVLSDSIGRKKPLILGYSLTFLTLFFIPFASQIVAIAILMGIYGIAWGIRTAPTAAFMGDNVKPTEINLVSSLIWLTCDIGLVLGSFMGGTATLLLDIPTILKVTSLSLLTGILALTFIEDYNVVK